MPPRKKHDTKDDNSVKKTRSETNPKKISRKSIGSFEQPDLTSFLLQTNGQQLSARQSNIFFKRLRELEEADAHLIYRGDKKDRLLDKFNIQPHGFPRMFNDYLFMIGDKGRHFWNGAIEEGGHTIPTFDLTDTSKEFLEFIFDTLRSILIRKDYSESLNLRLKEFAVKYPDFMDFFKFKKNKKDFIAKILSANPRERLNARDFYLTLLHQFGKNDFYPASFLLSVTKRISVARSFIRWDQINDNGIILFGWVPKEQGHLLYNRFMLAGKQRIFQSIDLPTAGRFYKEQHEITLKGGLLPHYIIGYFYREQGVENFEVNPAIFDIADPDWPEQGLPVDQTHFGEQIKGTRFKKAFYITPPGDYYEF